MKFEDLPEYIQKHTETGIRGYKISFPVFTATKTDNEIEIPKAVKWLRLHSIEYDIRGYWFIPFEGERKPFPELSDLPKVFIGETELNPRDFRIGKLKKSKRVTKFSKYGR